MTEFQGVPEHPIVESDTGRTRSRRARRRGFAAGAVLAAVAAAAAGFAAISGSSLSTRPAGVTTSSASAPSVASAPTASAAAMALELATAAAGTGTGTVSPGSGAESTPVRTLEPTAAPTPAGGIVICNTPMTTPGGPGPACPPHPCPMATTGGVSSTPTCPAPPPCAHPDATTTGGTAVMPACPRPTPPPPPPPPPCNAAAIDGPSTTSASPSVIRVCPPPCEPTPAAGSTPASGPAVAMAPRCPATVVLTNADSGRTITVHAGTRILVRLSGGGTTMWTPPSTSNGSVVTEVSSSRDSQGDASGDFRAADAGTANLTAGGGARCTGTMRCPMYMRLWVVHVHVIP